MSLAEQLRALGRPLRIVVTGGRDYTDAARIGWALDGLFRTYGIARLAHGAARGADSLAAAWGDARDEVEVVPYPVTPDDWERLGKRAGRVRNAAMLDAERPDLLVAFPGHNGTAHAMRHAEETGIRVWRVGHGKAPENVGKIDVSPSTDHFEETADSPDTSVTERSPNVQPEWQSGFGKLEAAFRRFHHDNPHVYVILTRLAREWIATRGKNKLGVMMLYQRARWEIAMTTTDELGFKLNHNHVPFYARLIMVGGD